MVLFPTNKLDAATLFPNCLCGLNVHYEVISESDEFHKYSLHPVAEDDAKSFPCGGHFGESARTLLRCSIF